MIYDVRQSTTYHYASPVAVAHHMLRLTPIDRRHQRVHAASLEVAPLPVERTEGHDFLATAPRKSCSISRMTRSW